MSNSMTRGWKVTTHDLRPPVQGGEPIFDSKGADPAEWPEDLRVRELPKPRRDER